MLEVFFSSVLSLTQPSAVTQQVLGNYRLETITETHRKVGKLFFPKESKNAFFQFQRSSEEAPFTDFRLIDLGDLSSLKLEITGRCAQVCEHELYEISDKRVRKIFSGSYSSIRLYLGKYVVSGGSGCCAEEVQVFNAPLRLGNKPASHFYIDRLVAKCETRSRKISKEQRKIAQWLCSGERGNARLHIGPIVARQAGVQK